jgi:hypothetical protein
VVRRVVRSLKVVGVGLLAFVLACLNAPSGPRLIGEGRRVLFIGNSYLYLQDIPGIVQALADSAGGDKLAVETVAFANMALVDHIGLGTAKIEIDKGGWEWIVLQQGPSSVEVNRDTLRLAAKAFADMMPAGTKPALFSAWPQSDRLQDFPRAIESYTLAAADVSGLMLPVASAWLGAWSRDPTIKLYSDALHPSLEGAYLSGLVVYGRLMGKSVKGLPHGLRLHSGAAFVIADSVAVMLQAAADSANAAIPPS